MSSFSLLPFFDTYRVYLMCRCSISAFCGPSSVLPCFWRVFVDYRYSTQIPFFVFESNFVVFAFSFSISSCKWFVSMYILKDGIVQQWISHAVFFRSFFLVFSAMRTIIRAAPDAFVDLYCELLNSWQYTMYFVLFELPFHYGFFFVVFLKSASWIFLWSH